MSYYYKQVQFGPGGLSPLIKNIIIANVAVFLLQSIVSRFTGYGGWLELHFGLTPALFLRSLHFWQPFTYMFLHTGLFHILFNMFFLWMFGTEVERKMGSRQFAIYYLSCGIGAGVLSYFFTLFAIFIGLQPQDAWFIPTIGASGALFAVMLAFGLFFPDRMILVFFMFPVKAFYLVIGLGLLELYHLVFSPGGNVSYIAHLGGMLFGYLFLRYQGTIMGTIEEYAERGAEYRHRTEIAQKLNEQEQIDKILDKINREGMHKLSREERKILRDRSKRRRQ